MTVFEFHPGHSFLHGRDARFKLTCFGLLTLAGLNAGAQGLCLFLTIPAAFIVARRISLTALVGDLRYFFLLLMFVFSARALSTPGDLLIAYHGLSVTRQGLWAGGLVCARLLLVVLTSLMLIVSTKNSQIRGAVRWFFAPFPFVPEKRMATMIGLLVRFLPVILTQAKITSDAQRARCVDNRKNPMYRLSAFAVPFVTRVFQTADELVVAMEARCYSETRTEPGFSPDVMDWGIAVATIGCCSLALYLD